MSGICGILEFGGEEVSSKALEAMSRVMSQRGPDGETVFVDGHFGLAHRLLRVSVFDTGIVSKGTRIHVAVDGNLYNTESLEEELGDLKGHSTAEIVIQAYLRFGIDFISRLEGAFAIVLYDKDKERLIAARDKMGVKPLYYSFEKSRLLFASEIKPLISSGYLLPRINFKSVADYLSFQYLFGGKTFFQGIKSLEPSTTWIWEHQTFRKRRYWQFIHRPVHLPEEYYVQQTQGVLDEAIRSMDVNVGKATHLSGGLDSSIICFLQSKRDERLKTFSAVYPYGDKYDESPYANLLAKRIDSKHTFIYPTADDVITTLPQMLRDLEEPASDVAFSRYFVAKKIKEAHKDARVVYCGQGADELFGGYAFYLDYLEGRFKGPLYLQSYQRRKLFSRTQLRRLLAAGFYGKIFNKYDALEAYRRFYDLPGDLLDVAAKADIASFLPYWLQVEDRINSAHSMEVRYPFLYHKVVELGSRMPSEMKVRGQQSKYIFREAFRRDLPPEVICHEKIGLRTPSGLWFREELYDFAREVLLKDVARSRRFFDHGYIHIMLEKNRSGEANNGWQIWTLVLFELWQQIYMNKRVTR